MQALVRSGRRSLTQTAALSRLLGSSAPTLADSPSPAEQHAGAADGKNSQLLRDFQVYRCAARPYPEAVLAEAAALDPTT